MQATLPQGTVASLQALLSLYQAQSTQFGKFHGVIAKTGTGVLEVTCRNLYFQGKELTKMGKSKTLGDAGISLYQMCFHLQAFARFSILSS